MVWKLFAAQPVLKEFWKHAFWVSLVFFGFLEFLLLVLIAETYPQNPGTSFSIIFIENCQALHCTQIPSASSSIQS